MEPRSSGPQFELIAPEAHGWDVEGRCRLTQHDDKVSSYPPGFLHFLRRISEGNYAMLGMVEHGDSPCYVHMTSSDELRWRQRWLPRDDWSSRVMDETIVDTVHFHLQDPSDGSNRLRKRDLTRLAGPDVKALFLHSATGLTPSDVLELVCACSNLEVLSLSECVIDDRLLHGIAKSRCAASLKALRIREASGQPSTTALGAVIIATAGQLLWLDVQSAFADGPAKLDHAAWLIPLRACSALRVAILPPGVLQATLAATPSPFSSQLELLSVERADGGGPHTPLSTIEPLVRAGLTSLDLHGFYMDDAASEAACAAANRLIIRSGGLPRAQLLKCARLAELHVRCELTEGDVLECLAELPALRSLHLRSDGGIEPDVVGALGAVGGLRCLSLSGGLRNYYDYGEEIATKNLDALLAMAEGLDELVQLDLSGHYDAFYACVEGDYCPYDTLTTMACKLGGLRVLNLIENGRKLGWVRLRRELRHLNQDAKAEGRVGVTIHYSDGVTEYAGGARAACPQSEDRYDDDDDSDDSDECDVRRGCGWDSSSTEEW